MTNLSRRSMLSLAAVTIAAAAIPKVAEAATLSERTWLSTHWLGTRLDNSKEVIQVFHGTRSDSLRFYAIRSFPNQYHKSHPIEYSALFAEIKAHVDGFLLPECTCNQAKGPLKGILVSEQECPAHERFYYKNNWLKSSWDRAMREKAEVDEFIANALRPLYDSEGNILPRPRSSSIKEILEKY